MYTKKVNNGYYPVAVTYDKCLKYCPYGSCGVMFANDNIILVSYTTTVITLTSDGWLYCTGTYSATTRKHIGAFLKEYAPMCNYHNAKFCYENNVIMNIYTGECIDIK